MLVSLVALAGVAGLCSSQSSFSPLRPPAIPLAVRSPYMSTWQQAGQDGGNGGYLFGQDPTFWQGQATGWQGFIAVDDYRYSWMGGSDQEDNYVIQKAFEYTSTRSTFTMQAGDMVQMKITFLSPVTPDGLLRSSLPYSYMDVEVKSLDGDKHSVQIYTDISAEWVTGDHGAVAEWTYDVIPGSKSSSRQSRRHSAIAKRGTEAVGGVAYHKVWRQQQLEFSETDQQADWGYWYYATKNVEGLTYQSGARMDVRGQFLENGYLANTEDTNYRAIDNDDSPVFGFSVDLGQVGTSSVSTLFQLSLHQENCVQFEGEDGIESVPCLWTSYFDGDTSAVSHFYNDYESCSSDASSFDARVSDDSISAGGKDYLSITSLAVRQAFGALEYTNSPEEPWVFLKEISSNGNTQTVDVIFPFHPIAVYTNPALLRYMLDPLFIHQEAGYWPLQFSIHDLGYHFPNATGHNDGEDEMQPLEECGNMLIMALAYAQRTGDNDYLNEHYNILKQWNNYLVNDSLIPMNQISTDDFAGSLANQTDLAIKGIIGIEAMAQIANRTGNVEDGKNFTKIAHDYVEQWMDLAVSGPSETFIKPHTSLAYGRNDTYSLLYNLFGDKELGLDLVPKSVYDMPSEFYPTVFKEYGVPLDTRHEYTKTDWEIFCASVADESTRDQFISVVAKWLNSTSTNFPFTDLYDTEEGGYPGLSFRARPVIGGMFALLALRSAPSSGYVQPS